MIDRKKMIEHAEKIWKTIDYDVVDCQQFVENCAKVAGWTFNSRGSNDMWRNYLKNKGLTNTYNLKPGDLVFKWRKESDKLPERYHGDGIGDIYHVGIVTKVSPNEYVVCHSASSKVNGRRDIYTSLTKLFISWKYAGTLKNTGEWDDSSQEEESIPQKEILNPATLKTGEDIEKQIWDYLKSKELNDYASAGIMGNLFAESGLSAINLNNSSEKKIGYNDKTYTAAVDDNTYNNFISDGAAYGLAQWAHSSRKKELLNLANETKSSIGNLENQLNFLWKELNSTYKNALNKLKEVESIEEASNIFLLDFEKPGNQSKSVQTKRATYSQKYYNKYGVKPTPSDPNENNNVITSNNKKYPKPPFNIKVINDKLNHRIGAGKNYKTLGFIPMGDYTITKVEGDWGFINDELGWLLLNNYHWVTITIPYDIKILATALNVRQGPGKYYRATGIIRDQETTFKISKTYQNWGYINNKGWICLDYTTAKI